MRVRSAPQIDRAADGRSAERTSYPASRSTFATVARTAFSSSTSRIVSPVPAAASCRGVTATSGVSNAQGRTT